MSESGESGGNGDQYFGHHEFAEIDPYQSETRQQLLINDQFSTDMLHDQSPFPSGFSVFLTDLKSRFQQFSKDDDDDVAFIDDLAVSLALAFGSDVPVKEEVPDVELEANTVAETADTATAPEHTRKDGKSKRVLSRREPLLNTQCIL